MHAIRLTCIMHYYVHILHMSIPLHSLLLMSKPPIHMSTVYNMTFFELTTYNYTCFVSDCLMNALNSVVIWIFTMDLVIYDVHIIHYHMDPLWLVVLGQNYFVHLDYLVIHCLIKATLLHPTIITPVEAQVSGVMSDYLKEWYAISQMVPPTSTSLSFFIVYSLT